MQNARSQTKYQIALAIFCLTAVLASPSKVRAAAGGIQDCVVGSNCTVGEFLYDDSSAPINDATCNITSWYPNDTPFIAADTAMDIPTQSDGWYSKSFTAPSSTGLYRTQVCCTVSADKLCIDKSFQVNSAPSTDPAAIASEVWGFSGRTVDSVSSFGTLIADIWANATRTLTGASLTSGSLATKSDVDGASGGTGTTNNTTNTTNVTNVTNTTDNAVVGTINEIKKLSQQTRLLMEQVVNKPVIENVLEESAPPIGEKLNGTRAQANQLYINNQFLTTQMALLAANWNSMNGKDALDAVITISEVVGESGDPSSTNTMFGQANWIKDSWNWEEAGAISAQLSLAQSLISDLKNGLADYQKTPLLLSEAKQLVQTSLNLEKIIGTTSDGADKKTLFAKIASTQALAMKLDDKSLQIEKVLGDFTKSNDYSIVYAQINDLQNQVIALNKIPGGATAITKIVPTDPKSVTNSLLSLIGVIDSNKKLLALGSGQTMVNIWLEVGSIIFKTMATNPSQLVSQKVDIKYYLPKEIKQADIIKTDAGLTVNYDTEKDQLYVSGTFNLTAGQTRTFSIETKDIWQVTPAEIQSIRDQANELSKPLEKTSFYAQGVTLKSDINAAMDQIEVLNGSVTTPEDKIQVYRQAKILTDSANSNLVAMKGLVTQASAAGSLFGFVGGAQTIAVWGLILVITAGFVFMTIYMKVVIAKAKKEKTGEEPTRQEDHTIKPVVGGGVRSFRFAAVVIIASIVSAGTSGLFVSKIVTRNLPEKVQVLGTQSEEIADGPLAPSPAALPKEAAPVQKSPEFTGTGGPYLVTISDTPTSYLNVMATPGGVVVAQVKSGDLLPFLDEQDGWYQVKLESGSTGWVSSKYSSKD